MLSERIQTQKVTYCMIPLEVSRIGKSIERDSILLAARQRKRRDGRGVGMDSDYLIGVGFPLRVIKMFWSQIVRMVTHHCECTISH